VLDSRTLRSTPENGARAGYHGAKRKMGSKLHMAVDTLGHLLAAHVTPATTDDRAAVGQLAQAVQVATDESVDLAYVDQGYTGEKAARAQGIELEVVKLAEAKRGFVLLPRRWVVLPRTILPASASSGQPWSLASLCPGWPAPCG
jgi:transposase